jgi:hypothetical protein
MRIGLLVVAEAGRLCPARRHDPPGRHGRLRGRDVATQALRDPERILDLCDKAPRDRGLHARCLAGAVPVITDFWGASLGDQATELRRRAPAEGKPACYAALHHRAMDLYGTPAERRRTCEGFEPAYRKLRDHA